MAGDQVATGEDLVTVQTGGRAVVAFLVTTIAAILGFNLVVLKVAIEASGPITVQAYSAAVAAVTFLFVTQVSGTSLRLTRKQMVAAALVGLCLTVGSSLGIAAGVQRVDAGVASLLVSTAPLLTLILGTLLLRERYSWHGPVGVLVGFLGVGLVAIAAGGNGNPTELVGVIFTVLGALGWSLGLVLMKLLAGGIDRSAFIAWQTLLGVPFLFIAAGVVEGFGATWTVMFVLAITYAGAVAKGTSFFLQLTVVRLGTPTQASLIAFLMPVFGIGSGAVFLGEQIEVVQIYGGLTILIGVALVLRATARRETAVIPSS